MLAVILPLKCVSDTLVFNFYSVKRSHPLYQYGVKLVTSWPQPPVARISCLFHHTQLPTYPLAFTYVLEDIVSVPTVREKFVCMFIEIVLKQICEASSFLFFFKKSIFFFPVRHLCYLPIDLQIFSKYVPIFLTLETALLLLAIILYEI